MTTLEPMTTDESLARINGWTLVCWDAVYDAACDSVLNEMSVDSDPDDETLISEMKKSVDDAVTNTWRDGISHDDWTSAALRRLRKG